MHGHIFIIEKYNLVTDAGIESDSAGSLRILSPRSGCLPLCQCTLSSTFSTCSIPKRWKMDRHQRYKKTPHLIGLKGLEILLFDNVLSSG